MFTVACYIRGLYVGRYTGTYMDGKESQAEKFVDMQSARRIADGLQQTRPDMVFKVADVIGNVVYTSQF